MNFNMMTSRHFLTNDQYGRFRTLVLERTGMLFGVKRRNALGRGITMLCGSAAQNDLDRYFLMLHGTETDSPLWDALIEELTVGETYFFRDENQMRALREHILPRIIAGHQHDRRIRIWSAGCASGEEAFTLAMLLTELIPDIDRWNITILATDINKKVLEKGRAGRYRPWSFRQTDPVFQSRYFKRDGAEYEAVPAIRKNVYFEYLNLSEPVYPSLFTNTNAMDLILCRNVAIYYSEMVVRFVVERFHRCLLQGGWLMMGAAETSIPVFNAYAARNVSGGTVYQKLSEPCTRAEGFGMVPKRNSSSPAVEPMFSPKPAFISNWPEETVPLPENDAVLDGAMPETSKEAGAPPDFFRIGMKRIRQKRYEEAMDAFLMCIASNPKDAKSLYQLGRVNANIGRMEAARAFCEQAVEINPLKPEVYYTLALIHQESDDVKGALEKLKRALFLEPDFALAHFSLAVLYRKLDQLERSERHRSLAAGIAARLEPESVLPGADDLTARILLTMANTLKPGERVYG